ncbi:MAG TPA: tRNA epoxyqueuosine(34) reductase QueG [Gemmatimonadetes bacterium]|nr:tRNA epoxyqueuosine(34) reductase QueG [Gemmatimonadota bacterium]
MSPVKTPSHAAPISEAPLRPSGRLSWSVTSTSSALCGGEATFVLGAVCGLDYHETIKRRLIELRGWIQAAAAAPVEARAYVDTGPVLERELAQRAGVGWFGKNTMLIHPKRGSYFFLGVLLLDLDLDEDEPFQEDHCGTCRSCLEACPTGALLGRDGSGAPVMDATRCISYLTIEHRGPIPVELRPLMGNRVYGCDICQEVCPWNERFAEPSDDPAYGAREGLDGPSLLNLTDELLSLSSEEFSARFRKSPIKRAKRAGLLRNLCIALGNWGMGDAESILARALGDDEPMVRGHAAWALGRIDTVGANTSLQRRLKVEMDAWVREEIVDAAR